MGSRTYGRRHLLAAVGAGIIAGGGLQIPFSPAPSKASLSFPERPSAEEPEPSPVDESATPYAVFQYASSGGGHSFRRTLPINIVFPLHSATYPEVRAVFRDAGWAPRPLEFIRYAYDRSTSEWIRSTWSAAESVSGIASRIHIRLWHLEGRISLQAHVDSPPTPTHRILSHEDARNAVKALFDDAGWRTDGSVVLHNASPPDHPGEATLIRR